MHVGPASSGQGRLSSVWSDASEKAAPGHRRGSLYDSAARRAPVRGALVDLYRYRALVRLLVARDMTVRYKRSLLGVTWTVLNPLLTTLVMWVVSTTCSTPASPGRFPTSCTCWPATWSSPYFQQGVNMTAASIASSAGMLTKVYVPPVIFAILGRRQRCGQLRLSGSSLLSRSSCIRAPEWPRRSCSSPCRCFSSC